MIISLNSLIIELIINIAVKNKLKKNKVNGLKKGIKPIYGKE